MKATIERLREWNRTIRASGLSDLLEEAASKLEEMEQLREQDGQQMSALIAGYQRIQRDCIDGTESRAGTDDWKTVSATSESGDQESKSPERDHLTAAALAPLKVDRITLIVHHRNRDGLRFWASRLAESFACCERVSLPKGEDEREHLTDAEREAGALIVMHLDLAGRDYLAATLRGLLERLSPPAT